MRVALALAVVLAMGLGTAHQASAASAREEGRLHAKKASRLSAAGKCRPAIPEFTRAYELLKDPALLFNRAECLRKLGDKKRAAADYREFLAQMPNAPNHKLVEARLSALDPSYEPPPPVEVAAQAAPPPTVSRVPDEAPAPPVAAAGAVAEAVPAPVPGAPPAADGIPGAIPPAETEAPLVAPALTLPVDRPAPVGLGERPPPDPAVPPRTGTSPWVWVGVAALAVTAGVVGGLYLHSQSRTEVPTSTLGNYRF